MTLDIPTFTQVIKGREGVEVISNGPTKMQGVADYLREMDKAKNTVCDVMRFRFGSNGAVISGLFKFDYKPGQPVGIDKRQLSIPIARVGPLYTRT